MTNHTTRIADLPGKTVLGVRYEDGKDILEPVKVARLTPAGKIIVLENGQRFRTNSWYSKQYSRADSTWQHRFPTKPYHAIRLESSLDEAAENDRRRKLIQRLKELGRCDSRGYDTPADRAKAGRALVDGVPTTYELFTSLDHSLNALLFSISSLLPKDEWNQITWRAQLKAKRTILQEAVGALTRSETRQIEKAIELLDHTLSREVDLVNASLDAYAEYVESRLHERLEAAAADARAKMTDAKVS